MSSSYLQGISYPPERSVNHLPHRYRRVDDYDDPSVQLCVYSGYEIKGVGTRRQYRFHGEGEDLAAAERKRMDTFPAGTFSTEFFSRAAQQLGSEWFAILPDMVDPTRVIQSVPSGSNFPKTMKQVSMEQWFKFVSENVPGSICLKMRVNGTCRLPLLMKASGSRTGCLRNLGRHGTRPFPSWCRGRWSRWDGCNLVIAMPFYMCGLVFNAGPIGVTHCWTGEASLPATGGVFLISGKHLEDQTAPRHASKALCPH